MQRYTAHDGCIYADDDGLYVLQADAQAELDRLNAYHRDERRSSAAMSDQLKLELDRVIDLAVRFANRLDVLDSQSVTRWKDVADFLNSPEVRYWREQQKDQP